MTIINYISAPFKKSLKNFLILFSPLVLRLAEFYGIQTKRQRYGVYDQVIRYGKNRILVHGTNKVILNGEVHIAETAYFNTRSGNIYIGKNTAIGEYAMLVTGKHLNIAEAKLQGLPFQYVPVEGRDIVIGEGCWIACGAIIIGGVKIGDYSVVSAGAVVTKDVPERTVVAGVPARVIKQL